MRVILKVFHLLGLVLIFSINTYAITLDSENPPLGENSEVVAEHMIDLAEDYGAHADDDEGTTPEHYGGGWVGSGIVETFNEGEVSRVPELWYTPPLEGG